MTSQNPGDSFGTFLRVLHGEQATRDALDEIALAIVRALADGGPVGLSELRRGVGADKALFWQALQRLMNAKVVDDIGTADADLLALTEAGRTVASLARHDSE